MDRYDSGDGCGHLMLSYLCGRRRDDSGGDGRGHVVMSYLCGRGRDDSGD